MSGTLSAALQRATTQSETPEESLDVLVEPTVSITQDGASTRRGDSRVSLITSWDQFDEMLAFLAAGDIRQARRAFIRAVQRQ